MMHKKTTDIDELYGQYVTQRLTEVQNVILKCDIKLEISNLFRTEMNQNNT